MSLSIVEIAVIGYDKLSVKFSTIPKSANPALPGDALRVGAYSVSGPGSVRIREVREDLSDLTSLELVLSDAMRPGSWSLTATDIWSPSADPLVLQTVAFDVPDRLIRQSQPAPDGYNAIAQAIGPATSGPNWEAVKKSLGWSAQIDMGYARFALDQLFSETASGRWLSKRAAEIGLSRSPISGMLDDRFRNLTSSFWGGKLTQPGLLSMLDALWGPDQTRAVAISESPEPYPLLGGEDLLIGDGRLQALLVIPPGSVTPGSATATELAAALSGEADRHGLAVYFETRAIGGATSLVAISSTIGLSSRILFLGGKAQAALRFPFRVKAFLSGSQPTWSISPVPIDGASEMTCIDPNGIDLSIVRPGDLACVYGAEFLPANRGTFEVLSVEVTISVGIRTQKVRISNPTPIGQVVAQAEEGSCLFFRPDASRPSAGGPVLTQAAGRLDVSLPTTSPSVSRTEETAGYLPDEPTRLPASASRLDGTTTFFSPGHDVQVGETIDAGESIPDFLDAPVISGGSGLSDYSAKSIWSTGPSMSDARLEHATVGLPSGGVLACGGWDGTSYLSSSEIFRVSAEAPQPGGGRQLSFGWVAAASRPYSASRASAIRLPGTDSVLVAGGWDGTARSDAAIYDELTDSWIAIPSMPGPLYYSSVTCLAGTPRVAWVVGGRDAAAASSATYMYDLSSNSWAAEPSMATARYRHSSAGFGTKILVCGGLGASGAPLSSCEIFDAVTPGWATAGQMSWARYGHHLVDLGDGRILAVGGIGRPTDSPLAPLAPIAEVEVFDFQQNSWTSAGDLPGPVGLGAAGVSSGAVWVATGGAATSARRGTDGRWRRSTATSPSVVSPGFHFGDSWAIACGGDPPTDQSYVLIPNRETTQGRGVERFLRVSAADLLTFSVAGSGPPGESSSWSLVEVVRRPLAAPRGGPYAFSAGELAGVGSDIFLAQDVVQGSSYSILSVVGLIPDGVEWLAADLGGPRQIGPFRYLGRAGAGLIRVELVSPKFVPSGTPICALFGRFGYDPSFGDRAVYCAPSDAIAFEARDLFLSVSGGGLPRSVLVRYPSDAGMGASGWSTTGPGKLSDATTVWSGK